MKSKITKIKKFTKEVQQQMSDDKNLENMEPD